jgi:hypothetical protein
MDAAAAVKAEQRVLAAGAAALDLVGEEFADAGPVRNQAALAELTSWCTIDAQPCPSGLFDWWGYRSAQRSDTSPAMASMVSSKCSRRPM